MSKWIILFLCCPALWAVNQLSVQNPAVYGSRPGYIDEATLVVEPHGAFVEQSLYLNYSDHHVFNTSAGLEVVHRFELPAGSVVNDMWLWIADSVMQAICLDTWTARAIYDSIVSFKRDPAFLTKTGDQYELHIYPLLSGSFRKVKINFITPTRWQGATATAVLPVTMLQVNSGLPTPLTILFREKSYIWNDPRLVEFPNNGFKTLPDTLDWHFKTTTVTDVYRCTQLTLEFGLQFPNGLYCQASRGPDNRDYFQVGLLPDQLFQAAADTMQKKYVFGLDVNPPAGEDADAFLTELGASLTAFLTERDRFQVIMTGADQVYEPDRVWQKGSAANITAVIAKCRTSPVMAALAARRPLHILYTDNHAMTCWSFPGIEKLVTRESGVDIVSSRFRYRYADVVAAYDHGHENVPSQTQITLVTASLDSFFTRGGRLLSFYDYNRVAKEKLASFYINGLTTLEKFSGTVFRNVQGNIGAGFPASFHHPVANILSYNDPNVRIEAMDARGRPVVISKKIRNGLLVVSGLWSFQDDAAMRSLLATPLLGLSKATSQQLPQLLDLLAARFQSDSYNRGLVLSYSDSLLNPTLAQQTVAEYLQKFQPFTPTLHTVTLLSGRSFTPPSWVENGIAYYGSGYWLKTVSEKTGGQHFERHLHDWNYISQQLSGSAGGPVLSQFNAVIKAIPSAATGVETRRLGALSGNGRQPVFFIGSAPTRSDLHIQLEAVYAGNATRLSREFTLPGAQDSVFSNTILPAMLANEWIKEKLDVASFDTAGIVQIAKKYRLLCDYTALIALEPNDTLHYMKSPFDESKYPATPVEEKEVEQDSLQLNVFPNPFNERTAISVHLRNYAQTGITVYNMLGQRVCDILRPTLIQGERRFYWDGRDEYSRQVSSGIYFVRVIVQEKSGVKQIVRRILMMR